MQYSKVGLVPYRPQQFPLVIVRIPQHSQRLGRMCGENHGIVSAGPAHAAELDPGGNSCHTIDRMVQPDIQRLGHSAHVLAAPADDAAPLRPAFDLQQSMIDTETKKGGRGKSQNLLR